MSFPRPGIRTDDLTRVRSADGKALWQTARVIAAANGGDSSHIVIARRADVPYTFAPDERIDVRIECLDAMTGESVNGFDLVDVRRNWVAGDMSDRMFAVIDGMLISGLETGRVRAFRIATHTNTATADS